jgi:hypothetical protein
MDGGQAGSTTIDDHGIPARGGEMSVAHAEIGEHDVVALLNSVNGWPVGTEGTVLNEGSSIKFIEISNHRGEGVDYLDVPVDRLRLVWKCPPPPVSIDQERR